MGMEEKTMSNDTCDHVRDVDLGCPECQLTTILQTQDNEIELVKYIIEWYSCKMSSFDEEGIPLSDDVIVVDELEQLIKELEKSGLIFSLPFMRLDVIDNLNLEDRESLVLLMYAVRLGDVSCRRAATEILKHIGRDYENSSDT